MSDICRTGVRGLVGENLPDGRQASIREAEVRTSWLTRNQMVVRLQNFAIEEMKTSPSTETYAQIAFTLKEVHALFYLPEFNPLAIGEFKIAVSDLTSFVS